MFHWLRPNFYFSFLIKLMKKNKNFSYPQTLAEIASLAKSSASHQASLLYKSALIVFNLYKSMKKSEYILKSFINALGVFVYTSAVSLLLFNGQIIFGKESSFLMPLFLLLLFIISASITGLLVLGKPIHLYLSNLKKEAFLFLFSTLAWLVFFIVIIVAVLLLL
ncbi:MAG: hypothetical protein A2430_00930 [Candidatus Liptonbacteria bacterium RIFOXYC1_FULL_36_8]|uniref:Uncharacterized protein n=2 Tax=Candidatus Liptoniibacteriota TaxID=1817909 RepID=A0A1G2CR47_9BACT|nr:MAG: hypothetical protein A2430_00930 [Candidatus Liptonbacteria bacterium RIFOXYC1_FULL_36_8]